MSRAAQVSIALAVTLLIFAKLLYDLYAATDSGLNPNIANDAFNWAWPYYSYASASIRSGALPLWNPYTALGSPFVADLSVALFYPINWITLLIDVPTALLLVQFLTVIIGMASMYGYTRYLQLTWPASILCIVLFAYALFTETFHPVMGSSFCWFPALLWLAHRFFDSPGTTNALSIGVVLALCFLAGFPNFFLYTCMILFVYSAVVLLAAWPQIGLSGIASRIALLVPALLLMVGLIAVQLLPAYELSTFSVRAIESGSAYQNESVFEKFSLALMFRNHLQTELAYLYALGDIPIHSGIYYLGAALLLLPFAFTSKRYRTASIALGASFIFMSLFMISTKVPELAFLQKIPLADSLRIHGRGIAYTQCLLIVLAGVGLSALYERVQHAKDISRLHALLGTGLFVAYAALVQMFAFDIPDNNGFSISFTVCTLLIAFIMLHRDGSSWVVRCFWIIALVIVVDVSVHRSNRFLVPAFARGEDSFVKSNLGQANPGSDHYRVLFVPGREGMAYQLANVGLRYKVANISAYSPMVLARWENFIRYLAGEKEYDLIMSRSLNKRFYGAIIPSMHRLLANKSRIFDLTSVRYWFFRSATKENENALPRAYAVRHFIQTQDESASLAAIKANLAVMANTVVLENASPSFASAPRPVSTDQTDVVIQRHSAQRVDLEVDVTEPSIVVLTDAFYPGWEAFVDDEATPVFRANSVFRAVEVPPGKHRVSFRFHSDSLYWGTVITLISLALVIALVLREGARRRRAPGTSAQSVAQDRQ